MTWSRVLPATGRRTVLVLAAIALIGATAGQAEQTTTPPAPTPAAREPPDPLKFDLDIPVLIIYSVKPDKIADFDSVWAELRAQMAKSEKAEVKAFAESLRFFKVKSSPGVYVFHLDSPSKTMSYNPTKLLFDNFEYAKAKELYDKFQATTPAIQFWPLEKISG